MVNLDASTPQSRLIKKLLDGYFSLNMNNVEPLLSKDYQYELFPECAKFPKQTKESHLKLWGEVFSYKTDMIVHEVIEAPGKVVLHATGIVFTATGATFNHDTIVIYTIVEEDGELKIRHCKDFSNLSNPEQLNAIITGTLGVTLERTA